MRTIKRRASLVEMATAYAEQSGDEFVIPEDLSSLSDEELSALADQARANFDAAYGDGEGLTDETFAALAALTEGIEALQAEIGTRAEAAEARAAAAAELAARVRPAEQLAAETETETEDEGEDEPTAEAEEDEPAAEEAPESLEAAAARREIRVPMSSVRRAAAPVAPAAPAADGVPTIRDYMVASGEDLGVAPGSPLDFLEAGRALDRRLQRFAPKQYEAANRRGQQIREQQSLLTIQRPIPEELQVNSNDPAHVAEVFARAADESRLQGGSLVAAGGWCAPSEVLYDLIGEDESRDGLLSLPEIGVNRGGVSFTRGPDFADILRDITGFSFTEAEDVDGLYVPGTTPSARAADTAVAEGAYALLGGVVVQATTGGTTEDGPAPTPPAQVGGTVTDGTVVWTRVARVPNVEGSKPCYHIECPPFEEHRLDVDGLCITAGLLQSRGYPEVQARTIRGALVAHDHRINGRMIAAMADGSTAVALPSTQVGTAAPVLTAIELQTEHYRYSRRLSRSTTLEAVFPFWVRGAVRSDLSRRLGVDLLDVSNERIDGWFRQRGINPQFVYNWQAIDTTAAGSFTAWPTEVSFLLYSAGTWVRGSSPIITLDTIYDSVLLGNNDFTALFTEEGWFVAQRGQDSRLVTTTISADGATHQGVAIEHDGTAGS